MTSHWTRIGSHDFDGHERSNCLELQLPARSDMWGLVRMAVSLVASVQNATVDRIEDLRIAVAELCTLCAAGAGKDTTLDFVVRFDPQVIGVACTATDVSGDDPGEDRELPDGFSPSEISRKILEALVDEYGITQVDELTRQGWFLARTDA